MTLRFGFVVFLFFLLCSVNGVAQLMYSNSIELAIKNNIKVNLYDSPNGSINDSIEALNIDIETCIVDVDSCLNGWVRIKKYYYVPWINKRKSSDKNNWLKIENLESALQSNFSLYEKANSSSEIIFEIKHNLEVYLKVNIKEIKGEWIKIQFKINEILLEGWVVNTDLCPLKHTACNYPW